MKKIFILTGETSGDKLASKVISKLNNLNPNIDHPRWTHATERRIGDFLRIPTLMFNCYEEEVSHLYKGMDLNKYY